MALPDGITLVDLARTLAVRHPHLFALVHWFFGGFRWLAALFALFYFGAMVFMTVWTQIHKYNQPAPPGPPPVKRYTPEAAVNGRSIVTADDENAYGEQYAAYQEATLRYNNDLKARDHAYRVDIDAFKWWVGEKDLFVNGVVYLVTYAVLAIVILPIMEQVQNL